ncbi:MAG: hypothetical protein COW55_03980 [Rhodobacteraceae bacterium CG17_big_fil_post_rev_8_21_14_2_50_65_11]|nr:MAG: hypothetical protein COW55_03980 [Rhodobacteraceae bacterium CG17_big_fil_post_rev_8_21_14_2_50_65_11]
MGTGVAMKRVFAAVCLLVLTACGQGASDDPLVSAVNQIRSGLFNRDTGGSVAFTATRASLRESGITSPVMITRVPSRGIAVGLIQYQRNRGVTVWRSTDGGTISTANGVLLNTRGFGTDLHSLETAPLTAAFASGGDAEYSRLFRAVDGEGALQSARLYCRLVPLGPDRIDVLGRAYDTQHFRESCTADGGMDPLFENDFWRGSDGTIWKSRQWAGPELGFLELERVTN